jgi:chlorophyllide a reductase subunit X
MMPASAAVFGKGGVGKTFLAAHLAMAFGYSGTRTLLVGCDQKRDTHRALCPESRPSLMEALETGRYDYRAIAPARLLIPATPYVNVLELGPAPLLMGDYGAVYEQAFHYFDAHRLLENYAQVIFDVTEERLDASQAPLLQRVRAAIAVTDDSLESLFVANRMFRAFLIGAGELGFPVRILGAVHNRSARPRVFARFVERTHCEPLMTIPALAEVAALRAARRTVFHDPAPPRHLDVLIDGFLKIAQVIQYDPLYLNPVMPLEDADVWKLADGLAGGN